MLASIGNAIGCALLNLLKFAAVPVNCPKCKFQFKPFADHTFTHFSEVTGRFPCPRCGYLFAIGEDAKSARDDARFNPPGPFSQPAETQIERRTPSENQLLFFVPPAGHSGMLAFAIVWNAVLLPIAWLVFHRVRNLHQVQLGPAVIISLMLLAGFAILYGGIREKFASYLLFLSPELVRMQRRMLFHSTFDLKTPEVLRVKKVEFYEQNEAPVHGIEINAGMRQIRFGSALKDNEKNWLAWEIRDFLRNHGATQLPEEAASSPA